MNSSDALTLLLAERERRRRAKERRAESIQFPDWLKEEFPRWVWDWPHLRYLQSALSRVTTGECKRLMIQMPPRHGKSEMTTIRYPVWRLMRNPEMRIIIGCYNAERAESFSRRARQYARQSQINLKSERKSVTEWETASDGGVRAAGFGSGVTGYGADLLILDDPIKNREEAESQTFRKRIWNSYKDDFYTRLEPNGAIILIMTRWHNDDLAGKLLDEMDKGGEYWEKITLPALAEVNDPLGRRPGEALCPDRYDIEALHRIRRLQKRTFAALYQQKPQLPEGNLFRGEWIDAARITNRAVAKGGRQQMLFETMDEIVVVIDPSGSGHSGSDEVGLAVVGAKGDDFYVFDVWGDQVLPSVWVSKAVAWFHQYLANRIIGEANYGGEMVRALITKEDKGVPVDVVYAQRGKALRAELASVQYENGKVHHVGFFPEAEEQLCNFPLTDQKGQTDAIVWGIIELSKRSSGKQASEVQGQQVTDNYLRARW